MSVRVDVSPQLLAWARQRSGRTVNDLAKRFPKLPDWEVRAAKPTMRQLQSYAQATYTPLGYFFLPEPPEDALPIPDFRTVANAGVRRPTPDLLDVIYTCEQRQDWYRDHAEELGAEPVPLVGTATRDSDVIETAARLRDALGFTLARRTDYSTWTAALSGLASLVEDAGILVMISGVVGSNTHRKLDPDEFRGFSLVDDFAPVIFVNGADTKAAQIFTLAHELAHVLLGGSGVSRPDLADTNAQGGVEEWCNRVAAELLVPAASLETEVRTDKSIRDQVGQLARYYKVSSLVVLRRLFDTGHFAADEYRTIFDAEYREVLAKAAARSDGGNFYNTTPVRVSKTFARALIGSTLEGSTPHRDAYRLLGFKSHATFDGLRDQLGVA